MPGRVILDGVTNPRAISGVTVTLTNGTYVITPGSDVFQAPFAAITPQSTKGISFWLLSNKVGFNAVGASIYAEMVFDCASNTVSGTFTRTDTSVDIGLVIPPEKLQFEPGETTLSFSVTYTNVDEAAAPEAPAWVAPLRPSSRNRTSSSSSQA